MDGNLEDIVAAAKRGDPRAREALLTAARPLIADTVKHRRARRMQGRFDVSDVVQSVLLKLHRDFDRFEVGGWRDFLNWTRTYAIHHLRQVERMHLCEARNVDREQSVILDGGPAEPAAPDCPEELRELEQWLAEALARLTLAERSAFTLGRLQGRSHAEIAAEIGTTITASRATLTRALRRLRVHLGRRGFGPRTDGTGPTE